MEIWGSMAAARRYNSSASGWSPAPDRTRAITRRCSVMRRPLSTQSFSIRVTSIPVGACCGIKLGEILGLRKRQAAPEDKRVPAVIIALALARPHETLAGIKGEGGRIVDPHF